MPIIVGEEFDFDVSAESNLGEAVLPESVDLHGIDLHGIILYRATAIGANLQNTNLQDSDLELAQLSFSNLRGADLQRAILVSAEFEEADLRGADLRGANLQNTRFIRANLQRVNNLQHAVNLRDAYLQGADLRNIPTLRNALENIDVRGFNLEDANLLGAELQGINLQGINLRNAELRTIELQGADLRGADLRGADLRFANLNDIVFDEHTNFRGADLRRTAINAGVRFEGAIMDDVAHNNNLLVQEPAQVPQGRAYEVHNYFNALDIDAIREFVQKFNVDNNDINGNTISNSEASQQEELFTPLLHFIENSELFKRNEKEDNKEKLNRILTIAKTYNGFDENKNLLTSIIEFVCKQSDDFIEQYIRILKDECLNAYGQNGQSCIKGMFERIVTILGSVAITLTKDESMNQDNETYKTLKKLFREINFSELVQEWASTYLEDGEKEEELKPLSVEQRKEHFIHFMTTKYGALITPIITEKIKKEADDYLVSGVFDRMAFGVKMRFKGTTRSRKPKRTKGTRRTKGKKRTKGPKGTKGKKRTKKM